MHKAPPHVHTNLTVMAIPVGQFEFVQSLFIAILLVAKWNLWVRKQFTSEHQLQGSLQIARFTLRPACETFRCAKQDRVLGSPVGLSQQSQSLGVLLAKQKLHVDRC